MPRARTEAGVTQVSECGADGDREPAKQEEGTVEPTSLETLGWASHSPSRSQVGWLATNCQGVSAASAAIC